MELYARSAVQLIPQAAGTESGSLPSKLPNLLAAGVQILAICSESSEVASLLTEAATGTVVSDWTAKDFTNGVRLALGLAAEVDPKTRRCRAKDVLALCRVSSLAHLIVG